MSTSVVCDRVATSVAAELGWVLNLLVQSAPYAEPALEELERTLLPGVAGLRPSIRQRFSALWSDGVAGCPELMPLLAEGERAYDDNAGDLLAWLSTLPKRPTQHHDLLSEPTSQRRRIRVRIAEIDTNIRARRAYRDLLESIWEIAGSRWLRRGSSMAARARREWSARIDGVRTPAALARLMPPRHPLRALDPEAIDRLFRRRRRFTLVPMYFSMSGGHVADLQDHLQVGVPASALEPARRVRDADFIAHRVRIFAEPTRVRILIHLLSSPAGVMETARALRMTQPVVSEHVRRLVESGIVRRARKGARTVYIASPHRLELALEDARATLARWA